MGRRDSLELYAIARELFARRRLEPLDPETDPTSALLAVRHEGQPLPEDLLIGCVRQVLVVGIIAPTVMIGSIAVHLCRDPQLQQRLRQEPALIPDAVEELSRLYTPYRGFARTATETIERGGRTIHPGEPIALVYASANRDEAKFARADQFDLGRANIADHVAFGRGPHQCPGATFGRMQLRVCTRRAARTHSQLRARGRGGTDALPGDRCTLGAATLRASMTSAAGARPRA